jgi:NADH-quinone oxidoreductase subunit G
MSQSEAGQVDLLLSVYRATGAKIASIDDVEAADAILILGEDVTNTAPRIALALRQAVRNESFDLAQAAGIPEWQDAGVRSHGRKARNPLCQATVLPTRLDDVTSARSTEMPDGIADLGLAIAAKIRGEREAMPSDPFVSEAATALMSASRPLVISGTGADSKRVIEATGAVVAALEVRDCEPALLLVAPEVNSIGCAMLGGELDLETALQRATNGSLIVAENDLFRRVDPNQLTQVLGTLKDLVVADSLATPTASAASLVLPAATFVESTGTVVNLETRAQKFYAAIRPENDVAPGWRWFVDGAEAAGRNDLGWAHVDDVLAAASSRPGLQGLAALAGTEAQRRKVPRATHRFSGRTAMTAQVNIHEPRTPEDEETPLSWSMEGQHQGQPSELLPFVWAPGWNSNQSVFKFQQEVGGTAAGGDPGTHLLTDRATGSYPSPAPGGSAKDEPGFRLAPVQTIFGSDELSACSPPIAERAPIPFAVLNPSDAERVGVDDGGGVRCAELPHSLQVRLDPAMTSGSAGIPVGLSGTCWLPAHPVTLESDPDYRPPGDSTDVIARG